jgi:ssDNA-binding Zn-finger/Zn-ribbon topoisomerase 1
MSDNKKGQISSITEGACPYCGANLNFSKKDRSKGKKISCPKCKKDFRIEEAKILEKKKKGKGCLIAIIIFVGLALIGVLVPGSIDEEEEGIEKTEQQEVVEQEEEEVVSEEPEPEAEEEVEEVVATEEEKTIESILKDRDSAIEIIEENASEKWGDDYDMVRYEIDKQTEAYDWIINNAKYLNILENASEKWGDDYDMVKYEYEKQSKAYESLQ